MGTADVQGPIWGARAEDWALVQEPYWRPLYEQVLLAAGAGPGVRLLDVGCGGGTALEVARSLGADPAGLDASAALVAIARRRLPGARVEQGDAEALPFGLAEFDLVCSFNVLQFVGDVGAALGEAARVCRPGGAVAALVWGAPADCDIPSKIVARVVSQRPASGAGAPPLHPPGVLATRMRAAGLSPTQDVETEAEFIYADVEVALRALGAAPPIVRTEAEVGAAKVRRTLLDALAPFVGQDGQVRLRNRFRYVVAKRPGSE